MPENFNTVEEYLAKSNENTSEVEENQTPDSLSSQKDKKNARPESENQKPSSLKPKGAGLFSRVSLAISSAIKTLIKFVLLVIFFFVVVPATALYIYYFVINDSGPMMLDKLLNGETVVEEPEVVSDPEPVVPVVDAPVIPVSGGLSLDRESNKNFLGAEKVVKIKGFVIQKSDGYEGVITDGYVPEAFNETQELQQFADEEDLSVTDGAKVDPDVSSETAEFNFQENSEKPEDSLFILQSLDFDGDLLDEYPLLLVEALTGSDDKLSYYTTGEFNANIKVSSRTNSVVLKHRTGEVLDRVYVESWDPDIQIPQLSNEIGFTDNIEVLVDLSPSDKTYNTKVYLQNVNSSERFLLRGVSLSKGKFKLEESLAQFKFEKQEQYRVVVVTSSLFKSIQKESSDFVVTLAPKIPVEVGVSKEITKDSVTEGDDLTFSWNHTFYGIDAITGLRDLCDSNGRCFYLTWSSPDMLFVDHFDPSTQKSELTTQFKYLECNIRGKGIQTLKLTISDGETVIGEKELQIPVNGLTDGKSLCFDREF